MVKGCQRRVLHLKNPESGLFEEAFFFLKAPTLSEPADAREMIAEANRILLGCRESRTGSRPRSRRLAFLVGILTGAVIATATLIIIGLIV